MRSYDWSRGLEIERSAEQVLDAVFGVQYIIVRATKAHQKQKIDRFHIHRTDGRIIWRVDYKVDLWYAKTGNLALEHVSVVRNGKRQAMGWVHTTIADLVIFYSPQVDTAYTISIAKLRQFWPDIQSSFVLKSTQTNGNNSNYITQFYPVPLNWLNNQGLIESQVRAVGVQLRLRLRSGSNNQVFEQTQKAAKEMTEIIKMAETFNNEEIVNGLLKEKTKMNKELGQMALFSK
jgi:hypothetical protein